MKRSAVLLAFVIATTIAAGDIKVRVRGQRVDADAKPRANECAGLFIGNSFTRGDQAQRRAAKIQAEAWRSVRVVNEGKVYR